ncbi:hypothetical protein BH24GEM3_BH24GEM3_15260 [soil metagenome]|nr:hypothetical protein [Gemmatimonadota bacterium]MDQ3605290.1 hypothetical protein [Gemmatimonadota bacterium]
MNPSLLSPTRLAALLLVAGTFAFTPISAQERPADSPHREGFWIGFGLGPGNSRINCDPCDPEPLDRGDPWTGGNGLSGYVAAGAALRPNLMIGGEVNLWARRGGEQDRDATLALLSFIAQYYPLHRAGLPNLYLKGGLGAGLSVLGGGDAMIEGGGWGVQLGTGYDVRIRDRLALSPFANVVQIFAPGAAGENENRFVVGPRNPRYAQIGIGLTWRAR